MKANKIFLILFFLSAGAYAGFQVSPPAGGSGSLVTGSTDNAVLRADGTGGATSKGSACTITNGGRQTCVTDGTGTTEFDALTFNTASGGRPRLNFGATDIALLRVNSQNMVQLDPNNLITYFSNSIVVGSSVAISNAAVNVQNGGYFQYQTTGSSNSAFSMTDFTAGNDWDAILKVTSNKIDTINIATVAKASQTVPQQEWRKSDGTVYAQVGATGGIKPGSVTADPCADTVNFPIGTIFYNSTSNYPCFCGAASADLKMTDNTTACF